MKHEDFPRLLDGSEAALIDRLAREEFGLESLVLMERAALAAASLAREMAPEGRVLVLAGAGNNGGDALALSRLLRSDGREVRIFRSGTHFSAENIRQEKSARAFGLSIEDLGEDSRDARDRLTGEIEAASLVVDGLCGIGLSSPLRGVNAELVSLVNAQREASDAAGPVHAPVLALDCPSGISESWKPGDPVLSADATVCFEWAKTFLYKQSARPFAGRIVVSPIGFPKIEAIRKELAPAATVSFVDFGGLETLLPRPRPDSHKYQRGSVYIFAGSADYPGAATLASRSASYGPAGLVTLFTDPVLVASMAANAGSVIVRPISALSGIEKPRVDAILAGPGWGRHAGGSDAPNSETLGKILDFASSQSAPVVLDADAIAALKELKPSPNGFSNGLVLTPHSGELSRLIDQGVDRVQAFPGESALEAARRWNCVVVLKGAVTWIAEPGGQCFVHDGAYPVLGSGGSGDCLAGLLVSILAYLGAGDPGRKKGSATEINPGSRALDAALAGVVLLGEAGARLNDGRNWGPSSLLPELFGGLLGEFFFAKPVNTVYSERRTASTA